jgi:hypothetical protein
VREAVREIVWLPPKPTKEQQIRRCLDRMISSLDELEGLKWAGRAIWLDEQKRRLAVGLGLGSGRETKHGFRFTSLAKGHEKQVQRLIDEAKAGSARADWLLCSTVADLVEAHAPLLPAVLLAYEGWAKKLRALPRRSQGRPAQQLRDEVILSTINDLRRFGLKPTRNEASRGEQVGSAGGGRRGLQENACSLMATALAEARNAGKAVSRLSERALEKIWENRPYGSADIRRKVASEK